MLLVFQMGTAVGAANMNGRKLDDGVVPFWRYKHIEESAHEVLNIIEMAQHGGDQQEPFEEDELDIQQDNVVETYEEINIMGGDMEEGRYRILRSNPFQVDRPNHLQIQYGPQTTRAQIWGIIRQQWPDLALTEWRLMPVNPQVKESLVLEEEDQCLLLWAMTDLVDTSGGSVIVALEERVWNLRTGDMDHTLRARTAWRRHLNHHHFISTLDRQQECLRTPCVLTQNGIQGNWRDMIRLQDGDYVSLQRGEEGAQVRSVIGDPTGRGITLEREVPQDYATMASEGTPLSMSQRIQTLARRFQMDLTDMGRFIFHGTGMATLSKHCIAVFPAEIQEMRYTEVLHQAERDPFGLWLDLADRNLASVAQQWTLVAIHESTQNSGLDRNLQFVAVLHRDDRPRPDYVITLVEKTFQQSRSRGGRTLRNYKTKFVDADFSEELFYQEMDLEEVCRIHECRLRLNGILIGRGLQVIWDGAFIQVDIIQKDSDEQSEQHLWKPTMDVDEEEKASGGGEPIAKRRRSQEEVTQPSPPPGGSMVLSWMAWCFRNKGPRRSCLKRQSTASYHRKHMKILWWMMMLPMAWALQVEVHRAGLESGHRYGEAQHPGPLWLGTTNPSGVRGKEWAYAELPTGIWGSSETQLSCEGVLQSQRALKHVHASRTLKLCHGAPAPIRARSQDAGSWTGVGFISELPSRPVYVQWNHSEHSLGRVHMSQYWWGAQRLLMTNVYLWPKGPTWPKALQASNALLEQITKEVVLSRTGYRVITGDFNHDEDQLEAISIWKQQGWVEAQQFAEDKWQRPVAKTCKGKTTRDFVWLSPECVPFIKEVRTWALFADHDPVGVKLDMPIGQHQQVVWPMAAYIPWQQVDKDGWEASFKKVDPNIFKESVDEQYQKLWQHYEDSFKGFVKAPKEQLPAGCCGRGRKVQPRKRELQCPLVKPSRQGEHRMKNECLGRAVQQWFLQLRRFQSLKHALKAGKDTVNANLYQVGLWRAIRRGAGFQLNFEDWWLERPHRCQGSPETLPDTVPSLACLEVMHEDFHWNYRRFEAWHNARRRESLQATYEMNHYKIFSEVKPEPKGFLQHLEEVDEAQIIGVAENHETIQLDRMLPQASRESTYAIDDFPVEVMDDTTDEDTCMYKVKYDGLLWEGQVLTQTRYYITADEIQKKLEEFWSRRWWTDQTPSASDWHRILAFGKQFLPPGILNTGKLTVNAWSENVKRYSQRAARGPDSIDRLDLQYMPESFREDLVMFLQGCEQKRQWPAQASVGFVHPLAKKQSSVAPGDFRPVIIYSMIYRTWSSIRARHVLRAMAKAASSRQFGFMPHSDPSQVWMIVQSAIEHAIIYNEQLSGFVSDIQKAFENIPRGPIQELSEHLGMDRNVVGTWFQFLQQMTRHFMVLGEVGAGVQSNRGFPEGCAMSCVAMAIVDMTFHAYLQRYNGRCKEISYVDNLALLCRAEGDLHEGILCLQTWSEAWRLDLDKDKSYVWSTDKKTKNSLKNYTWRVAETEKDLGAAMAYGRHSAANIQKERIKSLEALWKKLKRSQAPEWQKWSVLRQAFWPRCFHGSSVTRVSWDQIKQLRTAATRALKVYRKGASPAMRLFYLAHEQCDPGFYHVWLTMRTFIRTAKEHPVIMDWWADYMARYQGQRTQGPFNKMIEVLTGICWKVEVPMVYDQDGLQYHILETEETVMYTALRQAWAQRISWELTRRKDMKDLNGIDDVTLRKDVAATPSFQRSALNILRDGTFVEASIHQKYDLTKDGKCKYCQEPDSLEHRCTECSAMSEVYAKHPWAHENWHSFPKVMREHLIPGRNPWEGEFRQLCQDSEVQVRINVNGKHTDKELHLFTDGSAKWPKTPEYTLAAWAVVNATEEMVIAQAPLQGLHQTSDRAELEAIVQATEIASRLKRPTTIWTDNSWAGQGLARMLENIHDVPEGRNVGEWRRLQAAVLSLESELKVQHIAGHRDGGIGLQDLDDWTAFWNNRADLAARQAHSFREVRLNVVWENLTRHHTLQLHRLRALRDLHWEVVEFYKQTNDFVDYQEDVDAEDEEGQEHWIAKQWLERRDEGQAIQEMIPEEWDQRTNHPMLTAKFGVEFPKKAIKLLMEESGEDCQTMKIGWLELAIALALRCGHDLPVPGTCPGTWVDNQNLFGNLQAPTLAAVLRLTTAFYAAWAKNEGIEMPKTQGINLAAIRVHFPLRGVLMRISRQLFWSVARATESFTAGRPIRTSNDLTRPLR